MANNSPKKEKGEKRANDLIPFLRDALNGSSFVNLYWENKSEMTFSFRHVKDARNTKPESQIYLAYNKKKGHANLDRFQAKQKLISAMDSSNHLKKMKHTGKVYVYQFVKFKDDEKADEEYLNSLVSVTKENSSTTETDSVTDETEVDSNQPGVTVNHLQALHKFLQLMQCYLHNINLCGIFSGSDKAMDWEEIPEVTTQRKELFNAYLDFKQHLRDHQSQVLNQDELGKYSRACDNCACILEILHGVQSNQQRERKQEYDTNESSQELFRNQQDSCTSRDRHDNTPMVSDNSLGPSSSTHEKIVSKAPMVSDNGLGPSSSTHEKSVSKASKGLPEIVCIRTIKHFSNSTLNVFLPPNSTTLDTAAAAIVADIKSQIQSSSPSRISPSASKASVPNGSVVYSSTSTQTSDQGATVVQPTFNGVSNFTNQDHPSSASGICPSALIANVPNYVNHPVNQDLSSTAPGCSSSAFNTTVPSYVNHAVNQDPSFPVPGCASSALNTSVPSYVNHAVNQDLPFTAPGCSSSALNTSVPSSSASFSGTTGMNTNIQNSNQGGDIVQQSLAMTGMYNLSQFDTLSGSPSGIQVNEPNPNVMCNMNNGPSLPTTQTASHNLVRRENSVDSLDRELQNSLRPGNGSYFDDNCSLQGRSSIASEGNFSLVLRGKFGGLKRVLR